MAMEEFFVLNGETGDYDDDVSHDARYLPEWQDMRLPLQGKVRDKPNGDRRVCLPTFDLQQYRVAG